MAESEAAETVRRIDEATQGFCVYPEGMNPDCVDCGPCRAAFLAKVERIVEAGGDARLLLIREGRLD